MTAEAACGGIEGLETLVETTYDLAEGDASLTGVLDAIAGHAGASALLLVGNEALHASSGATAEEVRRVEAALTGGDAAVNAPTHGYVVDRLDQDTGTWLALLQRLPEGAEAQSLAPLLPHLRRALALRAQAIQGVELALDLSAALARRISVGILALRRDRKVASCNAAARELLACNRVLDVASGSLVCRDRSVAKRLADTIAADAQPLSALAEDPASGDMLTLVLRRTQSDRWLLFAHDPARPPRIRTEYLAERYGLTPMEARLALGIAHGGSISSLARNFGVSQGTLRTQLKAVFRKSGTESQPKLILELLSDPILLFERERRADEDA